METMQLKSIFEGSHIRYHFSLPFSKWISHIVSQVLTGRLRVIWSSTGLEDDKYSTSTGMHWRVNAYCWL